MIYSVLPLLAILSFLANLSLLPSLMILHVRYFAWAKIHLQGTYQPICSSIHGVETSKQQYIHLRIYYFGKLCTLSS
jgi:hypothetical protein